MGVLKWYKRDPNAALHGMIGMTLEERGAYNTILDIIYAHDGAVDDDVAKIAAMSGIDKRIWARLRTRLLELGKIYVHGGQLRNRKADDVVASGLARVRAAALAGIEGARSRAQTIEILKGGGNGRSTDVQLPRTTSTNLSFLSNAHRKK